MSGIIDKAFDHEIFRKSGHQLIDQLADYLKDCKNKDNIKVLPWESPDDLFNKIDKNFNTLSGPASLFTEIISNSLHLHHPNNMGHQVGVPAPTAALADFISDFLNNSMAVYEVGPYSSATEKIVIKWTASFLGMGEKASGVLTSGGSMGNLTCLLAARQNKLEGNTWERGSFYDTQTAIMVSEASHYSIARAVKIMGWGDKGLVKIPLSSQMIIDHTLLEDCYKQALQEGKNIIPVAANACSTATGSYDPLVEIGAFCKKHNLWFHVDGAHGAGAALSKKYKYHIRGIEEADSVIIDFHKMLLSPALTTAVIFKDGKLSYETFSQKASYLLDNEITDNWFDIALRSLECTKKMMGVKIYVLLKLYGEQLFADYITRAYDLAADFANLLQKQDDFEILVKPSSNILCFRYLPPKKCKFSINVINQKIRTTIRDEGNFYIVQAEIKSNIYLRTTLMNPFTTYDDIKKLVVEIRRIAADLIL